MRACSLLRGAGAFCVCAVQTALVLDLLRSFQWLKENRQVDKVLMCGHSMGGASALITGGYLWVSYSRGTYSMDLQQ